MEGQIVVGLIVVPHGVRGEFRVRPLTERPEIFTQMKTLLLADGRELTIQQLREHKGQFLVKAAEVATVEQVEALRGSSIVLEAAELPPLPGDSYYVADLLGFAVCDENGVLLGTLRDILTTGSNDVFVVAAEEKRELLLPALKTCILEVNTAARRITAKLPEWAE